MLEILTTIVFGDAKAVRNLQVRQDRRAKNGEAVAVNAALALCPAPGWSAQLLQTFLIQLVLDMVVQKVPDVFTGTLNTGTLKLFGNSLCI